MGSRTAPVNADGAGKVWSELQQNRAISGGEYLNRLFTCLDRYMPSYRYLIRRAEEVQTKLFNKTRRSV